MKTRTRKTWKPGTWASLIGIMLAATLLMQWRSINWANVGNPVYEMPKELSPQLLWVPLEIIMLTTSLWIGFKKTSSRRAKRFTPAPWIPLAFGIACMIAGLVVYIFAPQYTKPYDLRYPTLPLLVAAGFLLTAGCFVSRAIRSLPEPAPQIE